MSRYAIALCALIAGLLAPCLQPVASAQRLTRIIITPPDRRLPLGETRSMTAVGVFDRRTTQDITDEAEWFSSNTRAVVVSNDNDTRGHVTAVGPGVAFISAQLNGISSSDTREDARVQVPADLLEIRIVPNELRLPVGFARSLDAQGTFSDGSVEDISNDVFWITSTPAVASISNQEGSRGHVQARRLGTARISAFHPETGITSTETGGDAFVTVPGRVQSINIRPEFVELPIPGRRRFSASALLEDGSVLELPRSAMDWISSDTRTAVVSNDSATAALVTAVRPGSITLSATHRETGLVSTANATIRVLGRLVSLDITPRDRSIQVGETKSMAASGRFENGEIRDLTDDVVWTSSDPVVARISNASGLTGQVSGLRRGMTFISARTAGGLVANTPARVRVTAQLVRLRVEPPLLSLPLGFTAALDAIGVFSDGTEDDVSSKVRWSTLDPRVIAPSTDPGSPGDVTALTLGTTTVVVDDPLTGISSSASGGNGVVTVAGEVDRLIVRPAEERLFVGDTRRFGIRAVLADGSLLPLSRRSVLWTTSAPAIATVGNDASTAGLVTAVAPGRTTVGASHPDSGIVVEPATLDVRGALQRIEIRPGERQITVGETRSMTAIGQFADGSTDDITDEVQWSSSDPTVVTIVNEAGQRGHITGVRPGAATLSASAAGGVSSSTSGQDGHVRVVGELVSIRILPKDARLAAGFTASLDAEGTFSDGSVGDISNRVTWSSSDAGVVAVSNDSESHGQLTPGGNGVAVISASFPETGVSSSATGGDSVVTVGGRVIGISVRPAREDLPIGLTRRLSVRADLDDGASFELPRRTVEWTSSEPAIAEVGNDAASAGLVTARALGEARISAFHPPTGFRSSASDGDGRIVVPGRMIALEVRPPSLGLFVGSKAQLNAFAILDDGRGFKLTRGIEFLSNGTAVASVANESGQRGVVLGSSPGSASITVRHTQSGLLSSANGGDATVLVFAAPESIRVQVPARRLRAGERRRLRALGRPAKGLASPIEQPEVDISESVEWFSSNPGVVRIEDGQALAVTSGVATISARDPLSGLLSSTTGGDITLRVFADLKRLKITPRRIRTRLGTSAPPRFKVSAAYSDGARVDVTADVTFQTADPGIAEIATNGGVDGQVLPISSGRTTVTATEPITGVQSKRPGRIIIRKIKARGPE